MELPFGFGLAVGEIGNSYDIRTRLGGIADGECFFAFVFLRFTRVFLALEDLLGEEVHHAVRRAGLRADDDVDSHRTRRRARSGS